MYKEGQLINSENKYLQKINLFEFSGISPFSKEKWLYVPSEGYFTVGARAWQSRIKIQRNFRFRPVLPGFDFVRPFFVCFCPKMGKKWANSGSFVFA